MLGWIIIFAILFLFGLTLGQSEELQTVTAGYGLSALFGGLFVLAIVVRSLSRHSS